MFDKINEEYKLSGINNISTNNKSNINNEITNITHMLILPYKGEGGQTAVKTIKKSYEASFISKPYYTECL